MARKKYELKTSPMLPFLDKSRLPETGMRKKKSVLKMYVETCLPKPYDLYFHSGVTKFYKKGSRLYIFEGKRKFTYDAKNVLRLHVRHVKATDWE